MYPAKYNRFDFAENDYDWNFEKKKTPIDPNINSWIKDLNRKTTSQRGGFGNFLNFLRV